MPVAKKTTNNKTNNKKQKTSLIQKLKLNTLKGRMLATVLLFALIGGGVMVYRSFAATTLFSFSSGNGTLKCFQGCNLVPEQQKNSSNVVELGKPWNNSYGYQQANAGSEISQINLAQGQTYQTCVYARVVEAGAKSMLQVTDPLSSSLRSDITINSNSFTTYCTPKAVNQISGRAFAGGAYIANKGPATIRVMTYYFESVDNTVPTPCSGKNC